jgi:hypothetical protein
LLWLLGVWLMCLCSPLQQRLAPLQAKKQVAEAAEDVDLDMVALEAESDAVSRQAIKTSSLRDICGHTV